MEEDKFTNNAYDDLDWDIVIEGVYTALGSIAIDSLPTQKEVDLLFSVIHESRKLDHELPKYTRPTTFAAQVYVLNRVIEIICSRLDGLATDTVEYKMFDSINALLFYLTVNPKALELHLISLFQDPDALRRIRNFYLAESK